MSSNNQPPTPTPEQIAARKQQLLADWARAVAEDSARYGENFTKKEFTFSREEHKQLAQQNTIKAIADNAINDLLNLYILPRVGITPTPEDKVTYDLSVGRFVVWEPKAAKQSASSPSEKASSTKSQTVAGS